MKTDLELLEGFSDQELIDMAYTRAANEEISMDIRYLILALVKRIIDHQPRSAALNAILPGLRVITDCVEKTPEGDSDGA